MLMITIQRNLLEFLHFLTFLNQYANDLVSLDGIVLMAN